MREGELRGIDRNCGGTKGEESILTVFGEGSEMRIKKENVVNKAKYTFLQTKLKLTAKSTYTKYFELR